MNPEARRGLSAPPRLSPPISEVCCRIPRMRSYGMCSQMRSRRISNVSACAFGNAGNFRLCAESSSYPKRLSGAGRTLSDVNDRERGVSCCFGRRMIPRHHRCHRSAICKDSDLIGDLIKI